MKNQLGGRGKKSPPSLGIKSVQRGILERFEQEKEARVQAEFLELECEKKIFAVLRILHFTGKARTP